MDQMAQKMKAMTSTWESKIAQQRIYAFRNYVSHGRYRNSGDHDPPSSNKKIAKRKMGSHPRRDKLAFIFRPTGSDLNKQSSPAPFCGKGWQKLGRCRG